MPSSAPYLNFDLLITRAGDRYRALVVDAPGGDADIFFDLPPSLPGFQDLLALTGPRRGLRDTPTPTTPAASLDEVGRTLYDAIFQGEVRDVLIASQREAADNTAGLRLRLRFHEDAAELATLPWEILYDAGQERFLALSESLPILRYLSLPRPRPALVTKPPLRILAVLASPDGLDELNLEGEWQVLAEALSPLVDDGKVVLERLASPTPSALQQRLLGDPVHVLHFVGHGVFDEDSRQGMLVLADERNQPKLMGARELATLLTNHTSLRLLYLNACEGALGDNANVFAGLAQRLVQGGAPAAIAMQAEISDKAGIDLARTFYTALATGRPVDAALTQARVTLAMNSSVEWATPVLFSRAPDNRLFDIRDVLPTPDCPYPGMKPFTEKQKEFFFGRDKEIDDAVNRLAKHPFLAVVGPSGSGKSSLVYAGILPALRASRRFGPGPWTVHTLRPSDVRTAEGKAAPFQALSHLISGQLSVISHQLSVTSHQLSVTSDGAAPAFRPQSPVTNPQSPTLLFIDQFEETFTLADAAERTAFLDAVHGLIGQPNLHILLTVRADFYAEMMAMVNLWEDVQARRLELTPLGEDELWAAIVEPAARVGVEVEDALATALIADARDEAGVLPLVQETLVRLWDKVEGRQLKRSAYRQMADGGRSGIQVAINDHANDIYHTLPAADRPIARRIFLRLIQFGEGRADTRRQQTVSELRAGGDDPIRFDETLRALVDGRLLTTSGEEGDPNRRVDISHEALIGGWALLQGWISEKRVAESTRRQLEDAAQAWIASGKQGGLLDDYELHEAEAWLDQAEMEELGISQDLTGLVEVSRRTIEEREAEKEAIRYRELEQQRQLADEQRLRAEEQANAAGALRKRAFWLAAAGVIAIILAMAAVFFGFESNQNANEARMAEATAISAEATAVAEAERANVEAENARLAQLGAEAEARRAQANQVAAGVQLLLSSDMRHDASLPLILAREAVLSTMQDGYVTANAEEALRLAVMAAPPWQATLPRHYHNGAILEIDHLPGNRLVTAGADQLIRIWDLASGEHIRTLIGHTDAVWSVDAIANEDLILSGGSDSSVRLWDASTGEQLREIHTDSPVWSVALSDDGRAAFVGREDGAIDLYDLTVEPDEDGPPLRLGEAEGRVTALIFAEEDTALLALAADGTLRAWDLSTRSERFSQRVPVNQFGAMDLSPDGKTVAVAGSDGSVTLIDVHTGEVIAHHDVGDALLFDIAFVDHTRLLIAADESPVLLWSLSTGEVTQAPGTATDGVTRIAVDPWSGRATMANQHGNIFTWGLGEDDLLLPFADHVDGVQKLVFSPDGKILASVGRRDGSETLLWDTASGELRHRLPGHYPYTLPVAFSPDGARLVTAGADQWARVWDLQTYALLYEKDHAGMVLAAAFSPSGKYLLTAGDNVTCVWSAVDGVEIVCVERSQSTVTAAAWHPELERFATADVDGEVCLWSVGSGEPLQCRQEHSGPVWSIAFDPNGRRLLTAGDDNRACLWVIDDNEIEGCVDRGLSLWQATFYADGAGFALFDNDAVTLWDTATRSEITPTVWGTDTLPRDLAFLPDGEHAVTVTISDDAPVVWSLQTEESLLRLAGHKRNTRVLTVAADPSGRFVATGGEDRTIRLWETQPVSQRYRWSNEDEAVTSIAYNSDALIATGTENGTVRLWSTQNQTTTAQWQAHVGGISLDFSPIDPTLLATGGRDGALILWDLASNRERTRLRTDGAGITSVRFSPDGIYLVTTARDNTATLWHVATAEEVHTIHGEENRALTMAAIDPTSRRWATVDSSGEVMIWDVQRKAPALVLGPHLDGLTDVQFSPDGRQLVTSGNDRIFRKFFLQVWDIESGELIAQPQGHASPVHHVRYNASGERLISAGSGGFNNETSVRVWDTFSWTEIHRYDLEPGAINALALAPDGTEVAFTVDEHVYRWPFLDRLLTESTPLIQTEVPILTPAQRLQYGINHP